MKLVKRLRTPSFISQPAVSSAMQQRKRIAMGIQHQVNPTKNPGSHGSSLPKMKK